MTKKVPIYFPSPIVPPIFAFKLYSSEVDICCSLSATKATVQPVAELSESKVEVKLPVISFPELSRRVKVSGDKNTSDDFETAHTIFFQPIGFAGSAEMVNFEITFVPAVKTFEDNGTAVIVGMDLYTYML